MSKNYLVVFLLCLVFSGCGPKGNGQSSSTGGANNQVVASSDNTELGVNDVGPTTTYEDKRVALVIENGIEYYRYSFVRNSCSTGEFEVEGFSFFCQALKDEIKNKGCARPQRRLIFNKYRCSGDFNVQPQHSQEQTVLPPERTQARYMELGATILEVVSGEVKSKAQLAVIKCASRMDTNGFTLTPGSRSLIIRDLDYRFGDGSSNEKNRPFALVECANSTGSAAPITVGHNLDPGNSILESVRTSPAASRGKVLKEVFKVRCARPDDASILEGKGIVLFPGSTLISSSAEGLGPIVVSCSGR